MQYFRSRTTFLIQRPGGFDGKFQFQVGLLASFHCKQTITDLQPLIHVSTPDHSNPAKSPNLVIPGHGNHQKRWTLFESYQLNFSEISNLLSSKGDLAN